MSQDFKNKMQLVYNSLIGYSNTALKNSKEDLPPSVQQNYYGKSEAYENAARLLDASLMVMGIFIESEETDREKETELQRREDITADHDIPEMVYYEA